VGVESVNPDEELKRLDEQIKSATELAALKATYFRLNEIMQAFPGDFDVQFTGDEIKQRLIARGRLLKQQETSPAPAPAAPPRALAVTSENPPQPHTPPAAPPRPTLQWNRAVVIGPGAHSSGGASN
jgi:hypothetical protein